MSDVETWGCPRCGALHTRRLDELQRYGCGAMTGDGETCGGRLAPVSVLECTHCGHTTRTTGTPADPSTVIHCSNCWGRMGSAIDGYRFSPDDEATMVGTVRATMAGWQAQGQLGAPPHTYTGSLARIAAHAVELGVHELRPSELEWIRARIGEAVAEFTTGQE